MNLSALHAAVAAVCPIEGVSADGRIDYAPAAAPTQIAAAQALVAAWVDPIPVAETSVKQFIQAMNDLGTLGEFATALAAAKATDRMRWSSYTRVPAANPVLVRVCAAAVPPIDITATMTKAQGEPG